MRKSLVKQTFIEAGDDQSEGFDALKDVLDHTNYAKVLTLWIFNTIPVRWLSCFFSFVFLSCYQVFE